MQNVKHYPKRLLSLLLALVMALALVPALSRPARAAATETVSIASLTAGQIEADIQAAIDSVYAAGGGEVQVIGYTVSVTEGISISIPPGVTVVWSANYQGTLDTGNYLTNRMISIGGGGTFELNCVSSYYLTAYFPNNGGATLYVGPTGADVIVSSGHLWANGDGCGAIISENGNVAVNGGEVGVNEGGEHGAIIAQNGDVLVSAGYVSAYGGASNALTVWNGNIRVSGGYITADLDGSSVDSYAISVDDGYAAITGGTVQAYDSTGAYDGDAYAILIGGHGAAAYLDGTCTGAMFVDGSGWIAKVAAGWDGYANSQLVQVDASSGYAGQVWETYEFGLGIVDNLYDYLVPWAGYVFNYYDLQVINNMIAYNSLDYPTAPAYPDAEWMWDNWPDVGWGGDWDNLRITDLSFNDYGLTGSLLLTSLEALEYAGLNGNTLTSINLSGLNYLYTVDCGSSNVWNLYVNGCSSLTYLYCSDNNLTTLDFSGCSQLQELNCSYNDLTALDLSAFDDLDYADLTWNRFTDESDVSMSATPNYFVDWATGDFFFWPQKAAGIFDVGDIAVINGLIDNNGLPWEKAPADGSFCPLSWNVDWTSPSPKRINDLYMEEVGLYGLVDLRGLSELYELYCQDNQITGIRVDGLTQLYTLNAYSNWLDSINVNGCSALISLDVGYNRLTSLNLSDLASLRYLYCESNSISGITWPSGGMPDLRWLDCSNNELTGTFFASSFPSLAYLDCSSNMLSGLTGLTLATNLESLYCEHNRLFGFDVTGLDQLHYLDCSYNYIDEDEFTNPGDYVIGVADIDWWPSSGWDSWNIGYAFVFSPQLPSSFVAALKVIDLPETVEEGQVITLSGTIFPGNATATAITNWWIDDYPDYTGSDVTGNQFTAGTHGVVWLGLHVANGLAPGEVLVCFFPILITPAVAPTPTPTEEPTPTPTEEPTPTPTEEPTPTPTEEPTPGPTVTPTAIPTPTPTGTPPVATPTPGPTATPTAIPTPTPTGTPPVATPTPKPTTVPKPGGTTTTTTTTTTDEDEEEDLPPEEDNGDEEEVTGIMPEMPINPFEDVFGTDWFIDAVIYVYDKGLMAGTSEDPMLFSPGAALTRGMVVTILYSLEGRPDYDGDNPFDDVADWQWYADGVIWAAENGIVSGYGDGLFGPDDKITREQMVTILYNYCKWNGIDVSVGEDTNILSYEDAFDISEWAIPAFQWACGAGIISGKPGGYLDPKGSATRAEFAMVMMKFLELIG